MVVLFYVGNGLLHDVGWLLLLLPQVNWYGLKFGNAYIDDELQLRLIVF